MVEAAFARIGEDLTRALLTGDAALYAAVTCLPLTIVPLDGPAYALTDSEGLQRDFDLYHRTLVLHGVTDIYRKILDLRVEAEDRVWVHYLMHILVRANFLVEPFPSRMLLLRQGGVWRIARIETSKEHNAWALGQAEVRDGAFRSGENP